MTAEEAEKLRSTDPSKVEGLVFYGLGLMSQDQALWFEDPATVPDAWRYWPGPGGADYGSGATNSYIPALDAGFSMIYAKDPNCNEAKGDSWMATCIAVGSL